MKNKKLGILLLGLLLFAEVGAQRFYPHSLAMGWQTNIGRVSGFELNAAGIAIDLNHQRNFNEFLSIRTGLCPTYMLPVRHLTSHFISSSGNEPTYYARLAEYEYLQFGLYVMPMLYHRNKNFSLFAGLAGGAGLQLEYVTNYTADINGSKQEEVSQVITESFQLGWRPVIGISFKLGSRDSEREMELSISRDDWWTVEEGSGGNPFQWVGFQIAYRHNFSEG